MTHFDWATDWKNVLAFSLTSFLVAICLMGPIKKTPFNKSLTHTMIFIALVAVTLAPMVTSTSLFTNLAAQAVGFTTALLLWLGWAFVKIVGTEILRELGVDVDHWDIRYQRFTKGSPVVDFTPTGATSRRSTGRLLH